MTKRQIGPLKLRPPTTMAWTVDEPKDSKNRNEFEHETFSLGKELKVFARQSNCAAVTHLADDSQPKSRRFIWVVVLVFGVTVAATQTYFSASELLSAPCAVNSEFSIQNIEGDMEFPKLHICTTNMFNTTILNELGFDDPELISYLMLATTPQAVMPNFAKNESRHQRLAQKFDAIMGNRTIKDLFKLVLLKCEDFIAGCGIFGDYIDGPQCCDKYFVGESFTALGGACVSTRDGASISQESSKRFRYHNFLKHYLSTIVNPLMGNQRGVLYAASRAKMEPWVALLFRKQYARVGQLTSLPISKTMTIDEEALSAMLSTRTCVSDKNSKRYKHLVPGYRHYTESNCRISQLHSKLSSLMKCHLLAHPISPAVGENEVRWCTPKDVVAAARSTNTVHHNNVQSIRISEMCVVDCSRGSFTFSPSYSDLELGHNLFFGETLLSVNDSDELAVLNFFFPAFVETHLVNHYPTINQWLGMFGGNLGLFLGASMITVIEVLVFLCLPCVRHYLRRLVGLFA